MHIRKSFDPVVPIAHKKSNIVLPEIRKKLDESGNSVYVKVGEVNIKEYVNSYAAGCSLKSMLERCSLMPINTVVQTVNTAQPTGSGDLVGMPTDYTEAVVNTMDLIQNNPAIAKAVASGFDFKTIMSLAFPLETNNKTPNESEVSLNGSNEPSND